STAPRSSTSPRRYSVFSQPWPPMSNGRLAIPTTRSTSGIRSRAEMNGRPISPVGPVTATVSMARFWRAREGWRAPGGAPHSPVHVDDLDHVLEAAQILGVAGVERQVTSQGRGSNHQIDRPTPAWLAAGVFHGHIDATVGARTTRVE